MDFWNQYAVDPKLELEGKEFDWGGGIKLRIARANNPTFSRMLAAEYEAHKQTLDLKDTEEQRKAAADLSNQIMARVMSKALLLGWTGPVSYKGQPLPYTAANAETLLLLTEFQNEVTRKANDFRNFRFQTEEADAKNSPTTSDGSSPGVPSSATSSS